MYGRRLIVLLSSFELRLASDLLRAVRMADMLFRCASHTRLRSFAFLTLMKTLAVICSLDDVLHVARLLFVPEFLDRGNDNCSLYKWKSPTCSDVEGISCD